MNFQLGFPSDPARHLLHSRCNLIIIKAYQTIASAVKRTQKLENSKSGRVRPNLPAAHPMGERWALHE